MTLSYFPHPLGIQHALVGFKPMTYRARVVHSCSVIFRPETSEQPCFVIVNVFYNFFNKDNEDLFLFCCCAVIVVKTEEKSYCNNAHFR